MISRKKKYYYLISLLLLFILLVAFNLGVFKKVSISQGTRGPYSIIYIPHQGAYHLIKEKVHLVGKMLDEQKISKINPGALFYDDPRDVPIEKLRSEGGYFVEQEVNLHHPFDQKTIPQRKVIVGTTKAHSFLAPFKIYPKVVEFMKRHQLQHAGPVLEKYLPKGIIEVEVPYSMYHDENNWPSGKQK